MISFIRLTLLFALGLFRVSATDAYLLDTAGLSNTEENYLIGTLQGIVRAMTPRANQRQ